jgi:putative ABC transport system ATP-binding protein
MIETSNLSFRYSADSPELIFPNLSCPKGEQLLLLGDSGCGKTTLLHLLCGLLQPAQGEVIVKGQKLGALTGKNLDRFRGTFMGIVFQRPHFVQSLTVQENLLLPYFLTGQPANLDQAKSLLDSLGVGHKAQSRPQDLSVGEQQRASIARALVHKPAVLLADEPTSALDDRSTRAVLDLLEEQAAQAGATLIIVTHDKRLKDRYNRKVELKSLVTIAS